MKDSEMDALFAQWAARKHHQNAVFNKDGIVNPEEWKRQSPRILFLLKEAYHAKDFHQQSYDLAADLRQNVPWSSMWRRVAQWTYGILHTTDTGSIPSYRKLSKQEAKALIQKIAVVNIKKSHGNAHSDDADLMYYAKTDRDLLYQQIELIAPDVIVCGYTMAYLNEIISHQDSPIDKKQCYCENYHYQWKNRIILDYYHPANQYPELLSYYGLVGCYQDAVKQNQKPQEF